MATVPPCRSRETTLSSGAGRTTPTCRRVRRLLPTPRAPGVKIDNRGTSELSDGTDSFELDDAVPINPEFLQNFVGLLGESGRGSRHRCGHVELHRVGYQFEFACLYYIFIRANLSIFSRLQGVLDRRPRSGERGEAFAPLFEGPGGDRLVQNLHGLGGVGGD